MRLTIWILRNSKTFSLIPDCERHLSHEKFVETLPSNKADEVIESAILMDFFFILFLIILHNTFVRDMNILIPGEPPGTYLQSSRRLRCTFISSKWRSTQIIEPGIWR